MDLCKSCSYGEMGLCKSCSYGEMDFSYVMSGLCRVMSVMSCDVMSCQVYVRFVSCHVMSVMLLMSGLCHVSYVMRNQIGVVFVLISLYILIIIVFFSGPHLEVLQYQGNP
jgi:hypothetical protein